MIEVYLCLQGAWTLVYVKTITNSLAEVPTDVATLLDVDAVRSHSSTNFCSCSVGTTASPWHLISTFTNTINRHNQQIKHTTYCFG